MQCSSSFGRGSPREANLLYVNQSSNGLLRSTNARNMNSPQLIVNSKQLTSKERSLHRMLQDNYTRDIAKDVLIPLIDQTSPVSLRALDWCVTNWSKQRNVVCYSISAGQETNIHHSYRDMLSHWKRRLFDPFRRRTRMQLILDGKKYETTLGQANFALWIYQSGTYAYVLGHICDIEANMNAVSQSQKKNRKRARETGVPKKREELTEAPKSMCVVYSAPSIACFDE